MQRKKTYFLIIFIAILFSLGVLFYYFFFTTKGSSFIAKFILSQYFKPQDIAIQSLEGSLSERLLFHDVEFRNLKNLPAESVVEIQRLELSFASFGLDGISVNIDNGRLKLPDLDPVLFYGSFKGSSLALNAYVKHIYLRPFLDLFIQSQALSNISGRISDLDIYITGSNIKPQLTGTFLINNLRRNGFSLDDCSSSFIIDLEDLRHGSKGFGEIILQNGLITGPKDVSIKLQESKIIFCGDLKNPILNIKGTSIIEGIKINTVLKGTMAMPDFELTSNPPLPQERLLLMLATGKSWKGAETAISEGKISVELARDFLDYFLFANSADKIAQRFGIDNVRLKYNSQTKGIGLEKTVSEKLKASYQVEKSSSKQTESNTTQKLGGEYSITESLSVGAEKELKKENAPAQEQSQINDKVILKYKKKF